MTSSGSSRLRVKVFALLLSLAALWAFAAYVTTRDGLNLLWVSTLDQKYGRPTDDLIIALQQERRLSLTYLGSGRRTGQAELDAQRKQTDAARAKLEDLARDTDVRLAASAAAEQRIDELFGRLAEVDEVREAVDSGRTSREIAGITFTGIIDAGFRIYGSLATLDDQDIAKDGRTLVQLTRAREVIAQEDALLAGALAAGRLTATEHARLVQLVGTQRFLRAESAAELHPADLDRYQAFVDSPAMQQLESMENTLIARSSEGGGRPVVSAAAWAAAMAPVLHDLRGVVVAGVDDVVKRATPAAAGVLVRLLLAGGLGLVALMFSIIMSITTARAIVEQLHRLRLAASDLATKRLPGVVERLRHGEKVDVAAEAPPLEFGGDEIGQVGKAFNTVQETAIRVAVEQAELRNGVRDLFLGLARRSQALLHRQLAVLDEIERRENDPHELAELFKVDHLATRMRRNAENLIVLSGAVPGRRWRNPIPFIDVVRGAVAEVEDYTRVSVLPIDAASLAGRAVSDVIHLLAELIENAASFSPPYTMVNVSGQKVANGFVVEVEDRGLGMKDDELVAANELVRNPPDFNLSSTARLGLFVVGHLAKRHSIDVRLRRSPYGGTTAIVLIPTALVVSDPDAPPPVPPEAAPVAVGAVRREEDDTQSLPVVDQPALDRRPRAQQPLRATPPAEAGLAPPAPPGEAPPDPEDQPSPTVTPAGLPFRVRQASLAAPLRDDPPAGADPLVIGKGRSPAETRSMMASYQAATRRGREAARRLAEAAGDTTEPAPGTESPPADERTDPR